MEKIGVCCVLSTLLAASGCASRAPQKQPPPPAATLAAHGIECHKERATGSLIEATVCTTPAERARAADDTQKTKDWMEKANAGPCVPTGPCN